MDIICGIYGLYCTITNKWYVGFSININSRWKVYKRLGCKRQPKLYNALKKYGWNNFKHCIIEVLPKDFDILSSQEKFWINYCDSYKNGYNLNEGGKGGGPKVLSEESKHKMRLKKQGIPLSPEHCKNLSIAQTGRKHSNETKLKMRLNNLGKVFSPETIEKMRTAKKGKILTQEHKDKIGKSGKGRKHSEATKEKMRIAGLKRYGKI